MWVAQFQAWHDSYTLRLTKRLDVRFTGYYLNTFREKGKTFVNRLLLAEGPDALAALDEMAHEPRVKLVETGENYVIYQLPELKGFHHLVLDRRFLFLKPAYVEKGFEYWTVASTKKKHLYELYKNLKKLRMKASVRLLSIRKQNPRFFHGALLADLTEKQRRVFELALHSGYYAYPRKADAQTLARLAGIKYTTFREHLRKAESKVMLALAGKEIPAGSPKKAVIVRHHH